MNITIPEGYQAEEQSLKNKIILVTGAASGIGETVSKAYAAHGATVILLDNNVPGIEAVYDSIVDAGHPEPALYPLDLEGATDEDYMKLAEVLENEFGRLDGLLHNAARRDPLTSLWKIDLSDWFEIMQTNLNAPYMLTRACIDLLNNAANASVIFTTDQQSREHYAYWGAYGVSKHALDALMKTFADELENQSRIRVNSIDPGAVKTSMRVKSHPGLDPNQMTEPETITNSYLYMMDDASKDLNAETILAQPGSD